MWWNLANIKTAKFSDDEVATMLGALERNDLSDEDRWNMNFALGKVFEDAGDAAGPSHITRKRMPRDCRS